MTPQEEKEVIEHIESRFQTQTDATLHSRLLSLLGSARDRLSQLLRSETYAFDERDRQTIQETADWIDQRMAQYESATVNKSDVRGVRQELGSELNVIAAIVTAKQREGGAEVPRVENLVVRIDDLVARVGTVIRDLERSGERVPPEVRNGHRRAADLVREAKATCSTSRPTGCTQLRSILATIEQMREPLCAIESPVLTFCH